MNITKEQQLLLELLRESLNSRSGTIPESLLQEADWNAVMTEARQQAVTLQAFDAAGTYRTWIPEEVYSRWFLLATRGMQNNLRVQNAQSELVGLLTEGQYPYVILKGSAAASYYPRPELRTQGDVDFLIDPAQKEEIGQMLEQAGYESSCHTHICHVVYRKPGAHLEMHMEPAGIPHGKPGAAARRYLAEAVMGGKAYTFEGNSSRNPEDARHGLILLLHMQHHMLGEGLGLRHLCDWAAFVQKTGELPFWEQELVSLLREIGLLRFTSVMTKLSARYLGICCPVWAEAEDAIVELVLEDILTGGNFGRKEEARAKAGSMISDHGKSGMSHGVAWNLYHTLHRSTEELYPRLKGHPVLLFFVDTARAIRYVFLTLIGKRPSHWKMYPHAMERREVYRRLGVFETE